EGFTTLAKDSIFMMPHLGLLAEVHAQAAVEVFEKDCLIYLGTCIAATGEGKLGKPCFKYSLTRSGEPSADSDQQSGMMNVGDLKLLPLGPEQRARVSIEPERGFDCGAGP